MFKKFLLLVIVLLMSLLAACGSGNEVESNENEELAVLEVDFQPPESAEVGESITLEATVTYGDELVTDADEVTFEYWLDDDEENSTTIEAANNEDGTYSAEVTFEEEGVYSIYAHTTARDMHTMPLKQIAVGDVEELDQSKEDSESDEENGSHDHADGFHIHFMEPETLISEDETELMVHLQMDGEAYQNADVQFEIWEADAEKHDWVDAEETNAGEYVANYTFKNSGIYQLQIHVQDDNDLHEHKQVELEVSE